MTGPRAVAGVGVAMLLVLAGCVGTNRLTAVIESTGTEHEPAIAGSVESVAVRVETMLRGLELEVVSRSQKDGQYLRCASRKGHEFTLVLTHEELKGAPFTRVRLQWTGAADNELTVRVLAGLQGMNYHPDE